MAASSRWYLSCCLVAYLSAAKPVEVLVDATGQFEPGGVGPELQVVPASLVAQEMMEGLECPVSDRVALGTACQCGGTKCEKSNFCYALEEDGTPSCEEMSRQDPSLLDLYGISKNGPADGKDVGAINGRELKFYKKSANSGLRFFYSDNFRVYGSHSASRWELKIDGATCPSGKMAQDLHVQPGMNPHRINGFGFHCKGVGKGDHKVTVHVGPTPGYTSAGRHDAYTGNGFGKNAAWHLEAQEIPADYQLYHFKSGAGPDGRSSGVVNGRTLKFKKLYKDSRLRLFYSDNLRSYSGSYASCRWTIRVDGQACKSGNIAGDVYVHPYDNPLRPRSFAGYCDDVSVGEHTVDVFIGTTPGYSSCGGHTGWTGSGGGAHYLLEAEEIPNPSSYPMLHYKMAHTSDGRDAGALAHYQLSFEKKNKETTLRLFFTENLRAYSHQHSCACTWELLVDSKHCGNVEIFGQDEPSTTTTATVNAPPAPQHTAQHPSYKAPPVFHREDAEPKAIQLKAPPAQEPPARKAPPGVPGSVQAINAPARQEPLMKAPPASGTTFSAQAPKKAPPVLPRTEEAEILPVPSQPPPGPDELQANRPSPSLEVGSAQESRAPAPEAPAAPVAPRTRWNRTK